jgi:hypothetical protein
MENQNQIIINNSNYSYKGSPNNNISVNNNIKNQSVINGNGPLLS